MQIGLVIAAATVLFFSSLVQSVIGFAFNLLAVPLLIWSGFTLAQSVAITSIPIFIQVAIATHRLRGSVPWSAVLPASALRYLTLPLGVSLLYTVNQLDPARIKQIVGLLLLAILLSQRFVHVRPRPRLAPIWDILAFGLSGIMLGMLAMGGPPVVLWLMAHDWPATKTRAFLAALFLLAAPVQIALLYWKLGAEAGEAFLWGLWATPLVIAGTLVGVHLGNRLDRERLRRLIMLFLFLTALASILSPWVGGR